MQRAAKTWTFAGSIAGACLLIAWLVVNKLAVLSVTERLEVAALAPLPPAGAGAVLRGEHLVRAVLGCTACHGPDLAGRQLLDDPARARIASANLTVPRRAADDVVRAVRYGVRQDGRGLWLMPNDAYRGLSDADLTAVVAYLAQLPAHASALPANRLYLGGRIAVALGGWRLVTGDPARVAPAAVAVAPTAEYGAYLFQVARCGGCHAAAGLPRRSPVELARLLQHGEAPDGAPVAPHVPLVAALAGLDATERAALAAVLGAPGLPGGPG